MYVLLLTHIVHLHRETQVSRLGTDRSSRKGRKSRLKERIKTPTTLGENPMAQVTYRGVTYDTENRPNKTVQIQERREVYRGVKFLVDAEGHKRVLTAA